MDSTKKVGMKAKLSALWTVLMINMIYADIYTIIVEIAKGGRMEDIPGEVKTIMAIAAIVTNIPIMMIYLSRVLDYKANRLANIFIGIFTIIYVVGGGIMTPHYIIIATIEVILSLVIISNAWRWKNDEDEF
jgi:hypothetical protein